ncbi:MAG: UDP-N-acetylmuramoyl-L-alanine--D-glutamate ligase [Planctomycetaceae bacterium]|nr:UDP-N-acetylmuramoyl-L-alanine--D-glutamate ligase [Planctomycetaceae bacterium]
MTHSSTDFRDRAVTVMGLGRFGGGAGVVRFLQSQGARVTVSDQRTADQLGHTLNELMDLRDVVLHLGDHSEEDFLATDAVVVNPAVRPGHPLVERARSRGARITSEIGLFWERCQGRIAAVTGSNGKSTTTKLLHHLLQADGRRAWLGGNIGGSLLSQVDRIREEDWVVLELSSFQLTALDELRARPALSVVTNFAPNHLDWHGTVQAYQFAKQTILRWQTPGEIAVLNAGDAVRNWSTRANRRFFDGASFPGRSAACANAFLAHRHQLENAAAAAIAAESLGVGRSAIECGMASFVGLPHRLSLAATTGGRRWYDDSASTTPESTLAALASFETPIVLLVGGADKGVDLTALADGIVRAADAAVLMGAVAAPLQGLIEGASSRATHRRLQSVVTASSLEEAVQQAWDLSRPGDSVLLSPACASFGWFANYVERGQAFSRLVNGRDVCSTRGAC